MRFAICYAATMAALALVFLAYALTLAAESLAGIEANGVQRRYNLIKQEEREATELLRRSIEREGLHVDADGK